MTDRCQLPAANDARHLLTVEVPGRVLLCAHHSADLRWKSIAAKPVNSL